MLSWVMGRPLNCPFFSSSRAKRAPIKPAPPVTSIFMTESFGSMVVAREGGFAPTNEEVQIGTLIGLQHVVDVELPVARGHRWRGRLPVGQAARQLLVRHMQVDFALGHIELDDVTVL